MTTADHFYVTVLSNNSMDFFPLNVQSAFTNLLQCPLDVGPGAWEVGLTSISVNKFVQDSAKTFQCSAEGKDK